MQIGLILLFVVLVTVAQGIVIHILSKRKPEPEDNANITETTLRPHPAPPRIPYLFLF